MILRVVIALFASNIYAIASYKLKQDDLEPMVVTSKPLRFGDNLDEAVSESAVTPHYEDVYNFKPSKELLLVPAGEYEQMKNYQLYHGDLDSINTHSELHSHVVEPPKNIYKHLLMMDVQPESKESPEDVRDGKEELVYGKRKPKEAYFNELSDSNLNLENFKRQKEKERNVLYEIQYQNRDNDFKNIRQRYKQKVNTDYFNDDAQKYHEVKPKFKKGENVRGYENSPSDLSAHYIDHMLEDNYWYQYQKSQQKRPRNKHRQRNMYHKDRLKKETDKKRLKHPKGSYCNVRNLNE